MIQNQPPIQPQNSQPIVSFVANKTAADLFNVNPGQEAILIDMDMPYVYRKVRTADNKLQPLQWFDLSPHKEAEEKLEGFVKEDELYKKFVRKEDLNRIISQEVEKRISECFSKPTKKRQEE